MGVVWYGGRVVVCVSLSVVRTCDNRRGEERMSASEMVSSKWGRERQAGRAALTANGRLARTG